MKLRSSLIATAIPWSPARAAMLLSASVVVGALSFIFAVTPTFCTSSEIPLALPNWIDSPYTHEIVMCLMDWAPRRQDSDVYSTAQPIPTLTWAVPVDPARLLASLEAYNDLQPTVDLVRLCHRFCSDNLLSRLPREVLDEILVLTHNATMESLLVWTQRSFKCFQGRCHSWTHYEPYDYNTEVFWRKLNPVWYGPEPSEEVKEETVRTSLLNGIAKDIYGHLNFMVEESHGENDWRRRMCTCTSCANSGIGADNITRYAALFESHFGIQIIIMHEAFSESMKRFFPRVVDDGHNGDDPCYNTLAFLVLPRRLGTEGSLHLGNIKQGVPYANTPSPVVYWESIDPDFLVLAECQRVRFRRAMQVLGLKPYFAITRLEALIDPSLEYQALGVLAQKPLPTQPDNQSLPGRYSWLRRMDEILEEMIEGKSRELEEQPWPKLMNITPTIIGSLVNDYR